MLVLTRKVGERIRVGDSIEIVVLHVQGNRVRIGFTAPPDLPIHRQEVYRRIESERQIAGGRQAADSTATVIAQPRS